MLHPLLAFLLLLSPSEANIGKGGQPILVVDLRAETSQPIVLAVQTCAGLFNRDETVAGAAYTVMNNAGAIPNKDLTWLADVEGISSPVITPVAEFLHNCMQALKSDGKPLVAGFIRYNFSMQKAVIPNIITLAAVLDAVPFEDIDPSRGDASLVFDASDEFSGKSPNDVTSFMYEHYVHKTSGLAKMNPGYDVHGSHPLDPPLTGTSNLGLADFIVKSRLFNFFLIRGCMPLTQDHALMNKIVEQNPWPKPVTVFGYDDTYSVMGGDIFEAETNCVKAHNLGQVASDGLNNLAFFSRKPKISAPLSQNPQPHMVFNRSKTYLGLVMGDGDNLNFIKGSRKDGIQARVSKCAADSSYSGCFPLLWTMSPAALEFAPDWLTWYFNESLKTKNDYFVLPPSGHTYSYPGEMPSDVQAEFVKNTENDAYLMSASASVSWEWALTWSKAIAHYFPQYSARAQVKGFFAVNVPFMLPVLEFGSSEFYKVLNGNVVLFKPREWRGYGGSIPPFSSHNYLTPLQMADEINGYPRGTVSHIYVTSDGGASLDSLYDMAFNLEKHVQIVSPDQLTDLALQAHTLESANGQAYHI